MPILETTTPSCTAIAINESGIIVGGCKPLSNFSWKPCLWYAGSVQNLNQMLSPTANLTLSYAVAISDDGNILAPGRTAQGSNVVALLTPILPVIGDMNCDTRVDFDDLLGVIEDWHQTNSPADLNHDLIVNVADLLVVIIHWTG